MTRLPGVVPQLLYLPECLREPGIRLANYHLDAWAFVRVMGFQPPLGLLGILLHKYSRRSEYPVPEPEGLRETLPLGKIPGVSLVWWIGPT